MCLDNFGFVRSLPSPFLIHLPHIGLLASVIVLVLVDEVHEEEQIVGQIVLLLHVDVEPVGYSVQVVLADAADEAVLRELVLDALQLVAEGTEGVDDETLDDGQQDDNDEQEERNVEKDSHKLVVGAVRGLDDVTDATARPHALVEVEHEAGEHVVTLLVGVVALLALSHVELPEEVKGQHRVDVADNREQANGQHQLLAVVCDGLQDDPQGGDADSHVDEVGGEEEVVVVAKHREDEVEQQV